MYSVETPLIRVRFSHKAVSTGCSVYPKDDLNLDSKYIFKTFICGFSAISRQDTLSLNLLNSGYTFTQDSPTFEV